MERSLSKMEAEWKNRKSFIDKDALYDKIDFGCLVVSGTEDLIEKFLELIDEYEYKGNEDVLTAVIWFTKLWLNIEGTLFGEDDPDVLDDWLLPFENKKDSLKRLYIYIEGDFLDFYWEGSRGRKKLSRSFTKEDLDQILYLEVRDTDL